MGFESLADRLSKARKILNKERGCKQAVAQYSHLLDTAEPLSKREETIKAKLHYWLKKLEQTRLDFKNL